MSNFLEEQTNPHFLYHLIVESYKTQNFHDMSLYIDQFQKSTDTYRQFRLPHLLFLKAQLLGNALSDWQTAHKLGLYLKEIVLQNREKTLHAAEFHKSSLMLSDAKEVQFIVVSAEILAAAALRAGAYLDKKILLSEGQLILNHAIELMPQNLVALYWLARLNLEKGDLD